MPEKGKQFTLNDVYGSYPGEQHLAQFADHPHPGVQKVLKQHKNGLLTGREAWTEIHYELNK